MATQHAQELGDVLGARVRDAHLLEDHFDRLSGVREAVAHAARLALVGRQSILELHELLLTSLDLLFEPTNLRMCCGLGAPRLGLLELAEELLLAPLGIAEREPQHILTPRAGGGRRRELALELTDPIVALLDLRDEAPQHHIVLSTALPRLALGRVTLDRCPDRSEERARVAERGQRTVLQCARIVGIALRRFDATLPCLALARLFLVANGLHGLEPSDHVARLDDTRLGRETRALDRVRAIGLAGDRGLEPAGELIEREEAARELARPLLLVAQTALELHGSRRELVALLRESIGRARGTRHRREA